MRARDLAEPYPYVSTDDDAVDAARLLAEHKLPALLVVDPDGLPYAIVPGSQLVGSWCPSTSWRTRCWPPASTTGTLDDVAESLAGLTVAEWLPPRFRPPTVGPDAASCRSPRSWPARIPLWSPSSNATATGPAGRRGHGRPPDGTTRSEDT